MPSQIKIGKFCQSRPKTSGTCAMIFETEPEKRFLEKFGQLFILINLNLKKPPSDEGISQAKGFGQKLFNFSEGNYYDPLKRALNIEKEFEKSLSDVNAWIGKEKVLSSTFFEKNFSSLDMAMVLVKEDSAWFSTIGDIKGYLVEDSKMKPLTEENKSGKFQNIVSGALKQEDVLFFTSENLFDYVSEEKIASLCWSLPPREMKEKLSRLIGEESRLSIVSLIIKKEKVQIPLKPPAKLEVLKEQKPLETEVEEETEKVEVEEEKTKKKEKEGPPERVIRTGPSAPAAKREFLEKRKEKKSQVISIEGPEETLKKLSVSGPIRFRRPKRKWKGFPLRDKIKNALTLNGTKFGELSHLQKALAVILIILAMLFTGSLVILARHEFGTKRAREYVQLVENLRFKQSALTVALIYEDSAKIKKILSEMDELLKNFPKDTSEQKETYELFQNKYLDELNKFYKLTTIEEPKMLADFSHLSRDIKPGGLAKSGMYLYIFNPNNNYIYGLDLKTNKTELVNDTSYNIGHIQKLISLDEDRLIGFDDKGELVSLNIVDKKLSPLKINRASNAGTIKDMAHYRGRLYLLEGNQILKYSKTIEGFGDEKIWLEEASIGDGISLTIDASIYVLKKTSQVFKFYQGVRSEFALQDFSPQGENLSKILTDPDFRNLYLLDPPTQRLIIFDKNGRLLAQFRSDKFENLKDFEISSREDKAWILAGTKVFEIEIK